MLQAVSLVASLAILLWSLGLSSIGQVQAASLTSVSDTLSDSDPGFVSNHVIRFTIPTGSSGLAAGEAVTTTFPLGFNISTSSVDYTDVDFLINGVHQTLGHSPAGATWGATTSNQELAIRSGTGTLSADDEVVIYVGTNASSGADATDQQVTNHSSTGSYEVTVETPVDSGSTQIVLLDDVTVSAQVDTVFTFSVSGFTTQSGIAVNGTSTTATSTATAIPFGTLSASRIVTAAQRLNVSTNAGSGFVVTVQHDGDLRSATGADINGFADGSYTNTPSNWASPSAEVGTTTTYGHMGLTSSDDLNGDEFVGCGQAATGGCWVSASTTPRQVFEHNGVADGLTADIGSTTVGYQVEISALQEAADDYENVLTYIATPTF